MRFAYYGLEEPAKDEVLGPAGEPPDRRLRAFLINVTTGESCDVVVSLTRRQVVSRRVLDPRADGQVPIMDQDFAVAEEVVRADPEWRAAMARRGLDDVTRIRACPLTAGSFGFPGEEGRRLVRVLAFVQDDEHGYAWAHPVDGVAAYVDLVERRVIELVDEFVLPVPQESGDYDDPAVRGPHRTTLRPIEITQPEGPSFTLEGQLLRWEGWSMRIGFDAREGLILHQISVGDGGRDRPVIYRASIPEMVVPYGDPKFRYWQTYFDTGEYLVGKWANSLELGCDCLGEIAYLDATVTGDSGEPRTIRNAICIHEEDSGILWKHTDIFNGSAQSRRQRRLVVSFFSTVGNYDYGFYWYFYLDGTIECEIRLTGALFTAAHPGGDHPHSTEVAPGLGAPAHQHLFSARLDMDVDGQANAVDEVDVAGLPAGPGNPYGNALVQEVTRLSTESQAARRADGSRGRTWRVVSTERTNRFGHPVGYTLYPEAAPVLLAAPDSPVAARAGVRHAAPVGHPVRPGAAVPGRGLREPASGRSRPAGLHPRRPGHRRDRHRAVAHLRADALPPAGGLAGDAGGPVRVHAEADRVLRPQPDAGRSAPAASLLSLIPPPPPGQRRRSRQGRVLAPGIRPGWRWAARRPGPRPAAACRRKQTR